MVCVLQSYQPPAQDPAILAFHRGPALPSLGGGGAALNISTSPVATSNGSLPNANHVNNSIRETGIVEKLLHSYGFIQCLEREARLQRIRFLSEEHLEGIAAFKEKRAPRYHVSD